MRRLFIVIAIGLALLCGGTIHAGDPEVAGTPLNVTLMQEAAEFEVPYYDAFISAGANKFTFVVPQGLRLKGDPATGRLTLGNLEGTCSLAFTILGSAPVGGSQVNPEACRAFLLKQHPGGKILNEFSASVCGGSGQGFDIRWKATEDLYQYERMAIVPTAFGLFVFTATSGRDRFEESRANLGLVLRTFRAGKDGKFKPVHIQLVN